MMLNEYASSFVNAPWSGTTAFETCLCVLLFKITWDSMVQHDITLLTVNHSGLRASAKRLNCTF